MVDLESPATDSTAPPNTDVVTLGDVRRARERIAPYLPETPLVGSATLGRMTGLDLRFKCENLQRTGSFKARGALNAILSLTDEQRERGVVTFSAGNHGQGLALAARLVGCRCVVFLSRSAVPAKIEAIRGYGAETRFAESIDAAATSMEAFREEHGLTYVSPYADAPVIAGQGTVGLEILEQWPEVELIIMGAGGGGLLAGVATAAKALKPEIKIIGVEPTGAATVYRSLTARRPLRLERMQTVADGLAAPYAAPLPLRIIEDLVDHVVLVEDGEIVAAMKLLLERSKLVVEPAGAAGLAGLLSGKAPAARNTKTAAILSGGNISLEKLRDLI